MATYHSTSSNSVKVITIGGILVFILVVIITVFVRQNYSLTTEILLGIIVLGTCLYFFSHPLKELIIENETLILKINIGKNETKLSEIESVKNVSLSALTMTGSKGFFGFIGSAMDGSVSFVKDRSQMIQLATT